MDRLTMRILDCLVGDEEQLQEVFTVVNFRRIDKIFHLYGEHYRLTEITLCLHDLEAKGLVDSRQQEEYPSSCGPSARIYSLTEEGRRVWKKCVEDSTSLYE